MSAVMCVRFVARLIPPITASGLSLHNVYYGANDERGDSAPGCRRDWVGASPYCSGLEWRWRSRRQPVCRLDTHTMLNALARAPGEQQSAMTLQGEKMCVCFARDVTVRVDGSGLFLAW